MKQENDASARALLACQDVKIFQGNDNMCRPVTHEAKAIESLRIHIKTGPTQHPHSGCVHCLNVSMTLLERLDED
jgi:hypothetical protein